MMKPLVELFRMLQCCCLVGIGGIEEATMRSKYSILLDQPHLQSASIGVEILASYCWIGSVVF